MGVAGDLFQKENLCKNMGNYDKKITDNKVSYRKKMGVVGNLSQKKSAQKYGKL